MKTSFLTMLLALISLASPVLADEQTAFKEGYKLGKIYSVADGVKLTSSEIHDTAETKAYRNGYPNEGKERNSFIDGWIKGYNETHHGGEASRAVTPQTHNNNILDCIAGLPYQEWMGDSRELNGTIVVRQLSISDTKNGFAVWEGNATSSEVDFALFRRSDGRPILAAAWAGYDEVINQNLSFVHLSFYTLDERGVTVPVEHLLPVEESGVKFELPHFGTTIIVADQSSNRVLQKWTWKDNRFVRIQ